MSGNAWVAGDAQVFGDAGVSEKIKLKTGYYFGFLWKNEKLKKMKTKSGMLLFK